MKDLPDNIQIAKNGTEITTPWISLLTITINDNPFRICDDNEEVTFQGNTYTPFPFQISTIKQTTDGKIPSLSISVSNVKKVLLPYIEAADGLINSKVELIVVNTGHLTEDYAELTMEFTIMGADVSDEWVNFTLGAPSPMRQRFPRDRYIAYSCPWTFNSPTVRTSGTNAGVECAYQGTDTSCKKTYADCQSKENEGRFGGYFGLSEDGFKVA